MKKINTILVTFSLIFFISCGNDGNVSEQLNKVVSDPKIRLIKQIDQLEKDMHKSVQIDNVTAGIALHAYSEYYNNYPHDSITPDYLFKAGEIATAIQQYPQALGYYQTIVDKYPEYLLVQESLFLQASLLDNFLDQDGKAKIVYEQLIQKFPKSAYCNDAKAAISNLGKTDEQLIKEFKKKNGEK
jgi:outer membrane protein assembly factor BamD (BamD/ComL family)